MAGVQVMAWRLLACARATVLAAGVVIDTSGATMVACGVANTSGAAL